MKSPDFTTIVSLLFQILDDSISVFIVSTYANGSPPDGVTWFFRWLKETVTDFRVQKTLLLGLQYAVVGIGNSLYKANFCKVTN